MTNRPNQRPTTATRRANRGGRPRVHLDLDEAHRLRADGYSYQQIAQRLGVGKTTVIRALTPAKGETVPSGGPEAVQNPARKYPPMCLMCGADLDPGVDEVALVDDFVAWVRTIPED